MTQLAAFLIAAGELVTYPAAQCSALFLGYGAYIGTDETDRAHAFRQTAHRLNPGREGEIDAFIRDQIRPMILLAEQYIYVGNRANARLFLELMEACGDYSATQPETRPFR